MKTIIISVLMLTSIQLLGQVSILGAWERQDQDQNRQILVLTDGYWSLTEYNIESKEFVGTMGGDWELDENQLERNFEFNTFPEGKSSEMLPEELSQADGTMTIGSFKWQRIDDGTPGALNGAWLITGRERDSEMRTITPGDRKTMKILSGTRFQWIAYNSKTMEFMGTGGGTYQTKDGVYKENIEFFSRDSTRVGASLDFSYELKDGRWHHRGKSSKGQPIYEIWSLRPLD